MLGKINCPIVCRPASGLNLAHYCIEQLVVFSDAANLVLIVLEYRN